MNQYEYPPHSLEKHFSYKLGFRQFQVILQTRLPIFPAPAELEVTEMIAEPLACPLHT